MIQEYNGKRPRIGKNVFIAPTAAVIGDVTLGDDVSIWYGAVLRGDIGPISVGRGSNIQDCSVVHVDTDVPAIIGENVVVGHGAVLHACTIGSGSLIGMGAIVLSHAEIGKESVVGAGALVTERKTFPDRSLIVGTPARKIRDISEEDASRIVDAAERYVEVAMNYTEETGIEG